MKTCETCMDTSCVDMGNQRAACENYEPYLEEEENIEDPLAATTATIVLLLNRIDSIESRLDVYDRILAAVRSAEIDEGEWG